MALQFTEDFVAANGTNLNGFNGWSVITGAIDIQNDAASHNSMVSNGVAAVKAISDAVQFPLVASYIQTDGNANAGQGTQRFQGIFHIGNNNTFVNAGINFRAERSNQSTSNSALYVQDGGTVVANALCTFQFVNEVTSMLYIAADGSGFMKVTDQSGNNTDQITWGARSWTHTTGGYVGIEMDRDSSVNPGLAPTMSSLSIETLLPADTYNAGTEGIFIIAPPRGTTTTASIDTSAITADRTYTGQDASGTLAFITDIPTTENIQDDIGNILADTTTIDLTYDDATPQITAALQPAYKGHALFDHFADQGNVTTGETDLYSDTIAASQLGSNGDKLEAEYGGIYVSSATATRQIKIYFGGTVIFDTGALTLSLSSAWTAYASIIRVSGTVIRYMISFTTEGAALAAYTAVGEVTGLTLSGTNVLKITGQAAGIGAATNDIVAKLGTISYAPSA